MFELEDQKSNKDKVWDGYKNFGAEEGPVYGNIASNASFHEVNRNNFVKKVYMILLSQLTITVGCALLAMNNKKAILANFPTYMNLLWVALVVSIVIMLVLMCCTSLAKTVPWNYVLLFAFTGAESYIVAFFCTVSQGKIVLMAALMTLGIVFALTLYAMTTKEDFTLQGGALYIIGMAVLLMVVFNFLFQSDILSIIISAVSAVLFGLYLVYDTQLIIGGKNAELDLDDYILGALMLYSDIIGLFLQLLSLLNRLVNGDSSSQ